MIKGTKLIYLKQVRRILQLYYIDTIVKVRSEPTLATAFTNLGRPELIFSIISTHVKLLFRTDQYDNCTTDIPPKQLITSCHFFSLDVLNRFVHLFRPITQYCTILLVLRYTYYMGFYLRKLQNYAF